MGLLGDIIDASVRHDQRKRRREEERETRSKALENALLAPKSKLNSALTSATLILLFLGIALIIVFVTGVAGRSAELALITAIVFILTALMALAMPWALSLEKKENTKLSIIFLAFVGVCAIFWIISAFLVYNIFKSYIPNENVSAMANSINFIRVALFITLQFSIANMVTSNVLRYKKKLIVFQSVMYVSYAYFDIYLSCLIWSFTLSTSGVFGVGSGLFAFISNSLAITLLIISFIYIVLSKSILRSIQKKKNKGVLGTIADSYSEVIDAEEQKKQQEKEQAAKKEDGADVKLAKLKEMYEKELITKEEYEAKRAEIISKM